MRSHVRLQSRGPRVPADSDDDQHEFKCESRSLKIFTFCRIFRRHFWSHHCPDPEAPLMSHGHVFSGMSLSPNFLYQWGRIRRSCDAWPRTCLRGRKGLPLVLACAHGLTRGQLPLQDLQRISIFCHTAFSQHTLCIGSSMKIHNRIQKQIFPKS